jgi:hypothetical protein
MVRKLKEGHIDTIYSRLLVFTPEGARNMKHRDVLEFVKIYTAKDTTAFDKWN